MRSEYKLYGTYIMDVPVSKVAIDWERLQAEGFPKKSTLFVPTLTASTWMSQKIDWSASGTKFIGTDAFLRYDGL